jgi:hypothetical protein
MRVLLSDDAAIERLSSAARTRPVRTWDEYADELWTATERTALAS